MKWEKEKTELMLLISATLGEYIYPYLHTLIISMDTHLFCSLSILIIGILIIGKSEKE